MTGSVRSPDGAEPGEVSGDGEVDLLAVPSVGAGRVLAQGGDVAGSAGQAAPALLDNALALARLGGLTGRFGAVLTDWSPRPAPATGSPPEPGGRVRLGLTPLLAPPDAGDGVLLVAGHQPRPSPP